jgi:hypothetical protein
LYIIITFTNSKFLNSGYIIGTLMNEGLADSNCVLMFGLQYMGLPLSVTCCIVILLANSRRCYASLAVVRNRIAVLASRFELP